jgi:hypothetical protein
MKTALCLCIVSLLHISIGVAQNGSEEMYMAKITKNDMKSSAGVPLKDPAEIIRQDRANVHKFGNPDGDDKDTFFSSAERRAQIPEMLKNGTFPKYLSDMLRNNQEILLRIWIRHNEKGTPILEVGARKRDQGEGFEWPDEVKSGQSATSQTSEVREVKVGDSERKPIMDAMRGPVSLKAGKAVTFTGNVQVCGEWAKFSGHVSSLDGKPFAEDRADELELDFLAVLKKVGGKWTTAYYGWSGDTSTSSEAREKLPDLPEALVPKVPN